MRDGYQSPSSTERSRQDSEDEVAELAGAPYPHIFEPEDTFSDHPESFN